MVADRPGLAVDEDVRTDGQGRARDARPQGVGQAAAEDDGAAAAQGLVAAGEVEQGVVAGTVADIHEAIAQGQPAGDVHGGVAVCPQVEGAVDRHAVGQHAAAAVDAGQGRTARGRHRAAVNRAGCPKTPRASAGVQSQRAGGVGQGASQVDGSAVGNGAQRRCREGAAEVERRAGGHVKGAAVRPRPGQGDRAAGLWPR